MDNIRIAIAENEMTATLVISKPEPFPDRQAILASLAKAGVVYGIDETVIAKIVSEKRAPLEQIVAKGTLPQKGEDAKLIWQADPMAPPKPMIGSDGKADFKQLQPQEEIQEGREILAILPAGEGIAGTTVTGTAIFQKGEPADILAGENIKVSEDGLNFYASARGYITFDGKTVSITNIKKIDGDVSYRTGNIKFNGTVHITGDIRSGFRVEASDAIYIDGNIEAAEVYSHKGDIVVGLGILGKGRAKIICGRSLYCGFVQDASVSVKEDIHISHYSINSDIYAGGKVSVKGAEGLIRGGKVYGERGVAAGEAGSVKKIKTEIGISGKDFFEADSQITDLIRRKEKLENELFLANKRKSFLELLQTRTKVLSPEKQEELAGSNYKILNILTEIDTINQEREEIIRQHGSTKANAISIYNQLYPGVLISIGHLQYAIDEPYEKVKIYRNVNEILFEKIQDDGSAE